MGTKIEKRTNHVKLSTPAPSVIRTEYDEPLAWDSNETVELGLAMLGGAKLFRQRADRLLGKVAWGESGGTEWEDEELFAQAGRLNHEAALLVSEYRRRVREHWICARQPAARKQLREAVERAQAEIGKEARR
jgi:hypothetical protein